jgi:outer membrane immunogenic protein
MKRMLFAGALLLAAAGSTLAADLPPSMPPPPPPPRAPAYIPVIPIQYNWGGVYIGLNGGYGFGNSAWSFPVAACPGAVSCSTGNFNINGPLVGGTLGANFQAGAFVFGIEGDGDWSNIKGSSSSTNTVCATCQTANTWLATLRGRAGVAWDRVLVYATGGGAAGTINTSVPAAPGFAAGSTGNTEFGWAAGGGLEFAITDNITAKIEYLYVDLQNGSFACTVATCGGVASVPVSFDTSLVRAGLNLKFNPF